VTIVDPDAAASQVLRDEEEVEARIRAICFKTGPPALIGAELEWTVHHTDDPAAPLEAGLLRQALGPHTPETLDPGYRQPEYRQPSDRRPSDHPPDPVPLPAGGLLTAEPGGQLEISSAPATSLAGLQRAVTTDLQHLKGLLRAAGLSLGEHGIDPHRPPRRLLDTPRYAAMEHSFDIHGPHGRTMMGSTAGLQVCLDAGTPAQVGLRWATVSALGPVLMAAFANSRRHAGRDTGWASARMATWWGIDPRLSHPPDTSTTDPAGGWARYALEAPLVCLRRPGGDWDPPPGVTLRDWVKGALPRRPTWDDLDYHLSTLFPPVRPRGYLEVRYLDTQPGAGWFPPVAVLATLLADDATTQTALDLATPTAGRWLPAAKRGLADRELRRAAGRVLDLACRRLDRTDLPAAVREQVADTVQRLLRDADHTGE
jgi:glutamate--cysteine ligase